MSRWAEDEDDKRKSQLSASLAVEHLKLPVWSPTASGGESVGRTVDTGNRAIDPEYAGGGRAERMASRSSGVQGFPGLSSGRV